MTRAKRSFFAFVLAATIVGPGLRPVAAAIPGRAAGSPQATVPARTQAPPDWERIMTEAGLVDVRSVCPDLRVDLKYSTTDNFVHQDVYGDLDKCFLRKEAAAKLADAQKRLRALKPGWRLLVYDGARPRRVQARFFAIVRGTDQQQYVADPARGSIHNYGAAVDLTIIDADGKELDMGTPFDFFGELAQPKLEQQFLLQGKLTEVQLRNRRLLRDVMTQAGFLPISNEWWHFDAFPREEVERRYKIIE
jgi:D-alanyl-D-alanine dipeptidase